MAFMRDYVRGANSPPSPVCKQNYSHLHSFCVGILFNCTALGIHLCKTSQFYILKTRLGCETYSSDENVPKRYYKIAKTLFGIGIHLFLSTVRYLESGDRSFTLKLGL